jgi:enoyl-CoA hydratase
LPYLYFSNSEHPPPKSIDNMNYPGLKTEIRDHIGIITMSRPEALNALNSEVINSLQQALKSLPRFPDLRALIITGEGKAFVAGADIKELSEMDPAQAFNFSSKGQQTFDRFEKLPFPVIAAINGYALGGGCELALACDIRIASKNAKFGMPETSLGLMPGFAGTQRLSRIVGYGNAIYLMTTSKTINAEEALRMGLVQEIAEPEDLLKVSMEIAKKITSQGKYAVRAVKEMALRSYQGDFKNSTELESEVFAGLFHRPEADEGMKAFIEKRKPNW